MSFERLAESVRQSARLAKCRKCGCIRRTYETIAQRLKDAGDGAVSVLNAAVTEAIGKLQPTEYS